MAPMEQLRNKPHPSRAIFQAHNIQIAPIARYLEVSYRHLSGVLSGSRKPSPELDHRVKELARELELEVGTHKRDMRSTITSCIDYHRFIIRSLQKSPAIENHTQSDRRKLSVGV